MNIDIEAAARRDSVQNAATAMRGAYGFGDETDLAQLDSILKGGTRILAGGAGEGGQTITLNGTRYVTLKGVNEADTAEKKLALALTLSHEGRRDGKGMSVEEQLQMGVLLSQEAYRDGVVTEDNYLETRGAVLGHTEMAARMRDAGYNIADNPFIALDLAAYDYAQSVGDMSLMDLYADMLYRSDGDYMDFNWGAAWGSFGWGGIGTLLFGSPENKATVFQDAVVAGMEKEDEFDYMEKNYEKIKSEYDYKKLSFGSFNLSDYQMQIASVYGLIKKNAAAIDNGIDKLGVFQELARGAKNFIYDMANWIETRGNFTFLEGLYYTHQGGASFKIATGNMLTSPLMVGLYEQNLFKRGDRAALTIGMDIGVSAWTNGLLFKDITLGFKYAFPAFNLEVQHPRLL